MSQRSSIRDNVERGVPYVMPAIGGALGVTWVNLNEMQFLNPMIWIPLGVFLGWVAGRGIVMLMNWWS